MKNSCRKGLKDHLLIAIILVCLLFATLSTSSDVGIQKWKKHKFGLFIHWGIYSQLSDLVNITTSDIASWPMEWGSHQWSNSLVKTKEDMIKFRKFYWGLSKTFNPKKFDPSIWAEAAWNAGMRYVVITTKHHDGFSMYNTTLDNYSVMGSECPFKVDAFGEAAKAFKKKGFSVGAYFSKPDWHRDDFWRRDVFAESRHTNYDTEKYTSVWDSFRSFVQGQIREISEKYNPDILWFDGDWIKPTYEDLEWDDIARDARKVNKDVIIVNRRGSYYEDIITPEQGGIPIVPTAKPWELCQTMTSQWGYKRGETFKPTSVMIHTLLTVTSRGGNYLLDIGPTPDGEFEPTALSRLQELGDWMKVNSEGIHDSEPISPYYFNLLLNNAIGEMPFFFTKKDEAIYVYFMSDVMPAQLLLPFITEGRFGSENRFNLRRVTLLGSGEVIKFSFEKRGTRIFFPNIPAPCKYAFGLKLSE